MFTGLVEGMGEVVRLTPDANGLTLTLTPPAVLTRGRVPPSRSLVRKPFGAPSRRPRPTTAIGDSICINGCCLTIVQGHVDALGTVAAIEPLGEWVDLTFSAPADLTRLMVEKGSVAVDGVSLTVVKVTPTTFSVSLIPHTLSVTTLGRRRVGDAVNLEADILGKYVAKLLEARVTA